MFDKFIEKTLELREYNEKISYTIAKELALIEVNMIWYPTRFKENLDRLRSLSQHIQQSFKNNDLAKELASSIRNLIKTLENKIK